MRWMIPSCGNSEPEQQSVECFSVRECTTKPDKFMRLVAERQRSETEVTVKAQDSKADATSTESSSHHLPGCESCEEVV
eukprot:3113279-Rhodomonas_salina.2